MVSNPLKMLLPCRPLLAPLAAFGLILHARVAVAQTTAPTYQTMPYSPAVRRTLTAAQLALLEKLNRRDVAHLANLAEVIAPDIWTADELDYSPLPREWAWAEQLPKALVVHVPSQVFAAYEHGRLVRWGPVSTGRPQSQTPAGLFHLTWRAKTRRSTENDEWILKWYFNFINERGISFHEFELPGRPASHACVRLLSRDAKWIYEWGESWRLSEDRRKVDVPGTPVLLIGAYDFKQPAPWLDLTNWTTPIELPAPVSSPERR